MSDLLVVGGEVIDGTGTLPRAADVLVRDGRVTALGPDLARPADVDLIDARGLAVCPGFVDIHTHSDLTLLSSPLAISKVAQGVTTEVVGNCGLGVVPLAADAAVEPVRQAVSYLDLDPEVAWDWHDFGQYRDAVALARPSLNVAMLVGHLPLHTAVAGFAVGAPTRDQLARMAGLLDQCLDAGALGLSTGLVYAPLTTVSEPELLALAAVCARRDRVFAWHMHDYGRELTSSVEQVLRVAERSGCRVQVSHLQAVGQRNWNQLDLVLDRIAAARDSGLQVGIDIYPYLHGNAPLAQRLPAWAQEGTADTWQPRLRDPEVRDRVLAAWVDLDVGWDEITISWAPAPFDPQLLGRPVSEVAAEHEYAPAEWALELLASHGTAVMMVAGGRSEERLQAVLSDPATVVASDGLAMDPHGPTGGGSPHPRSFGCFPRYLDRYRPPGGTGLAEAVARCTSRPADLVGLDRGRIRVGAAADLVVMDPDRIRDRADFASPRTPPDGIEAVIVNGELVVDRGRHTGARPGQVLTC